MVLELKDVQNFKVAEEKIPDGLTLELSGLAFHSSMAVGKVTTNRVGNDLQVIVLLTPARKGLRGDFRYRLAVGDDVERVLFGNERKEVWRRRAEGTARN